MDDYIENQLPQFFEQAAAHLEPPVEEIVAASTVLGRRRRRRRTAGSACAAVGMIGLTAGLVIGMQRFGISGAPRGGAVAAGGESRGPSMTPATPPGTARPPTTGSPVSVPSVSGSPASALSISAPSVSGPSVSSSTGSVTPSTPQSAPELLSRLLAAYGLHEVGPQVNPIGVADLVFDDGHGQSDIIASVVRYTPQLASDHAFTCVNFDPTDAGVRPSGAPKPSCTKTSSAGGQTEYVIVTTVDGSGFYDYEVNLFASNGLVVALDVGNGVPQGGTVDVTRALPPLSLDQMRAVVSDPGWLAFRDTS
ncbi:hypothetical protein [Actinospica robiniae]|uniref:hypothetical protein n=1 Tax=Actinospica robiniae TaxID=304901 RepID=UPI0004051736|nr:hypothetical protein [Actinospica robiniae]